MKGCTSESDIFHIHEHFQVHQYTKIFWAILGSFCCCNMYICILSFWLNAQFMQIDTIAKSLSLTLNWSHSLANIELFDVNIWIEQGLLITLNAHYKRSPCTDRRQLQWEWRYLHWHSGSAGKQSYIKISGLLFRDTHTLANKKKHPDTHSSNYIFSSSPSSLSPPPS